MKSLAFVAGIVAAVAPCLASPSSDTVKVRTKSNIPRATGFSDRVLPQRRGGLFGTPDPSLNLTTVSTPLGPVTGFVEPVPTTDGGVGTVARFLGVPFASPPVGPNRFRSPQPVAPWTQPLDATAFGSACPQMDHSLAPLVTIDEDCLYLNVFAPGSALENANKGNGTGLPVMLFLYGGSWSRGSASLGVYDMGHDAGHFQNVIGVTINYRLELFGFAASSALRSESPDGGSGNYGLLDQRAALQWVKSNIASFGGDPTRVTLFGQSAGAGSTSSHLVMPKSNGLFNRAIMESGPWADWTSRTWEESANHTSRVATALKCAGNDAEVIACLRQATWQDIVAHQEKETKIVDWAPTVDGVELTDSPQNLGAQGKFNKDVDIVLGTNKDEATTFLSMIHHDANVTQMHYEVGLQIGSLAKGAIELYPVDEYKNPWWAAIDMFTDGMFTCPARRMAVNVAKHGGKSARLYFMTWELLLARFDEWLGVFHGNELAFVFRDSLAITPGPEHQLMDAMSTYWTQIAAKGDPNASPFPDWPAFTVEDQPHMEMNPFSLSAKPMTGEHARRCDWWDSVLAVGCHPFPLGRTCDNPPPVPPKENYQ